MKPANSTLDLKIFAWIGLAALVALLCLPIALGYFVFLNYQGSPTSLGISGQNSSMFNEPLGESGSHCGGPEHLPCGPGLSCSNNPLEVNSLGVCQVSPDANSAGSIAQLNAVCDLTEHVCAPGLYCKGGMTGRTCLQSDAQAPHIESLKLEGLQPVEGAYQGTADAVATLSVQAVNVGKALAWLVPVSGATKELGELYDDGGGKFSLKSIKPGAGFAGRLLVTVITKDGVGSSSLSVGVATLP